MDKKIKYRFEFLTLIKERKIQYIENLPTSINADQFTFAYNSAINIGEGFRISVQASSGHYCSPILTFNDLNEYEEFEILISYEDKYVVVINDDIRFSQYEAYIDEDDSDNAPKAVQHGVYIFDSGCPLAGYVPGNVVDSIINDLNLAVIKIRSRNVLIEKINKMSNFFKVS